MYSIARTHYNALITIAKAAAKNGRYNCASLHVVLSESGSYAEATDGHRALRVPVTPSVVTAGEPIGAMDFTLAVPKTTKLAPKKAGDTLTGRYSNIDSCGTFDIGDALQAFNASEHQFPDAQRCFDSVKKEPETNVVQLTFNPLLVTDVQSALELKHSIARFTSGEDKAALWVEFAGEPELSFIVMPCRW